MCNQICSMMWLFWNIAVACFYVCLFGSVHEVKQILCCPADWCVAYYGNVWDYALVFGSFWDISPVRRAGVKYCKCQFSARPLFFFSGGFRYLHTLN